MKSTVQFPSVNEAFDDDQIIPSSGLLPVMALADRAGLKSVAAQRLHIEGSGGANAVAKAATLVAAMVAGTDTIDGIDRLRSGATGRVFTQVYAPSTLGTFLRSMTADHDGQWSQVSGEFLTGLAAHAPLLQPARRGSAQSGPGRELLMIDIDDTVLPVKSHGKEEVGFTYQRCPGLSVQLVTASRAGSRPVILAEQLRAGKASGKPGGSADLVTAGLETASSAFAVDATSVLVRGDSAYYSSDLVAAVRATGAHVSVGVKQFASITTAIAELTEDHWMPIEYPGATWDKATQAWDSAAHVAEVPFTAFVSARVPVHKRNVAGRLVIRRVKLDDPGTLMPVYRHHAIFTTLPIEKYSAVAVDRMHRAHAIIEQVNADLKASALAHLPSAKFAANTAWMHLAAMAYNLLHAAAALTSLLVNATSAGIRGKLVNVPARVARSGRQLTLHLPRRWPWATAREQLSTALHSPPPATCS